MKLGQDCQFEVGSRLPVRSWVKTASSKLGQDCQFANGYLCRQLKCLKMAYYLEKNMLTRN